MCRFEKSTEKNYNYFLPDLNTTLVSVREVMRYKEYAAYAMNKGNLIRKFNVKIDSKIFEIYKTGQANKGSSTLRNKVYMIALFMLVPIIAGYGIYKKFKPDVLNDNNVSIKSTAKKVKENIIQYKKKAIDNYGNYTEIVEIIGNYIKVRGWFIPLKDKRLQELFKYPNHKHIVSENYIQVRFHSTAAKAIDNLIGMR